MILTIFSVIDDLLFDFLNNVDTFNRFDINDMKFESQNKKFAVDYMPTHGIIFKKLLKKFVPNPRKCTFVDFGSGKGKTLLLAAQHGFKESLGIEFSNTLSNISRSNASKFKGGKYEKSIKTITSDVLNYKISMHDNVFYFFNPFHKEIMCKVLESIKNSLIQSPRKITIIYYHPSINLSELSSFLNPPSIVKIMHKKVKIYNLV